MADGVIVAEECGAWSLTADGGLYFHDPGYSNMEILRIRNSQACMEYMNLTGICGMRLD